MSKYISYSFFFCCLPFLVSGQTTQKINFDIQGTVELDHISYIKKEQGKINSRNEGTLTLKGNIDFNEKIVFKSVFEARKDLQDNYRDRLYLREAYFTFSSEKADLKIGKQIINWGTADIYNPTDNINPVDYSDFFDFEDNKLGVWMANLKYFYDDNHFTELIISPSLPALAVPNPDSRWVLRLPKSMPNPLMPSTLKNIQYHYEGLRPNFQDAGLLLGIKNGVTVNGWDFSQSFLAGMNYLPDFTSSLVGIKETHVEVALAPSFERLYVLGLDFAKAFKKFGLRGEFALKGLSRPQAKGQLAAAYYEYIIGIDHTFSQLLFQKNVLVILQWIQQIDMENKPIANDNIRFFLQKAINLRTELAINYFSSFTIQTLYTLDAKNLYIRPSLKYRILDGLTVIAQADLLFGKPTGFLGQYINNDRFQLRVTYDF